MVSDPIANGMVLVAVFVLFNVVMGMVYLAVAGGSGMVRFLIVCGLALLAAVAMAMV